MARRRIVRKKSFRLAMRMKKKLFIVFFLAIGLLVFLLCRIIFIQISSGDRYEKIVLDQQEYASTIIPFRRGDIVDRKGTVLATSTDVYNVILDASQVTSKEAYIEPTLNALVSCFGVNKTEVQAYLSEHSDSQYYVLEKKIPSDQVEKFEALQEKEDSNIYGVWFEKEYIRKYPYNNMASNLLGFTTSGNVGIGGIEDYYNSTLNGTDGRAYGYMNSDMSYEDTLKEAVDGSTVVSTIDANIQSIVEEKIQDWVDEYTNTEADDKSGAAKHIGVILMDPNNGEILAMAQYPNYDPNDAWTLEGYYTDEEIKEMTEEERLDALNGIWQNFCISDTYEPGSTTKPFTVASGIDSGKLTGNETYVCGGGLQVTDRYIHCDNRSGHGEETVETALRDSCNVALMQMGFTIGPETFRKYQQIFNFGLRTNIDLPGEARTDSLLFSVEELTNMKTNLATNAFGQNFNVTMIQVISAYSSLVNGGSYYQPHVVKAIQDEEGNVIKTVEPTLLRRTVSESTSDLLTDYLQSVVSEQGTGRYAKVEGYSMCGKTGTAEKLPRGNGKYLVSFEGSIPAKDPQLVIYCVVDEPNTGDQAHSSYAQSIVQPILTEVLPYLNIPKDEGVDDDEDEDIFENYEATRDSDEDEESYEDDSDEGGDDSYDEESEDSEE